VVRRAVADRNSHHIAVIELDLRTQRAHRQARKTTACRRGDGADLSGENCWSHPPPPSHGAPPLERRHLPHEADEAIVVPGRQALADVGNIAQRPAREQVEEPVAEPVTERGLRDREEAALQRAGDGRMGRAMGCHKRPVRAIPKRLGYERT
jgi:hypothetical protein